MAIIKIGDRQYNKSALAALTVKHIGAGNALTFSIRPGTVLMSALVLTTTAFDTAGVGTAALTVTDGTTVFANAVDVKTAGVETVANAPKYYPAGGTITVSIAETVATTSATVGSVLVQFEYLIVGNGDGGLEA